MNNEEHQTENQPTEENLDTQEQNKNATEQNETIEEQTTEEILQAKLDELNDKYIRLYSEFDNFKRRTARERLELMSTASKDIMIDLLPVLDDMERAVKSNEKLEDVTEVRKGLELIHNKFSNILNHKGLKPFKSIGEKFDPEIHDALTKIPSPSKKLRGKVVDEIEKGYRLNDKVIRFAKVVVGE
jgi:molecular chaperone GrpE